MGVKVQQPTKGHRGQLVTPQPFFKRLEELSADSN